MARKIKVPKTYGEMSKNEQRFYWLTSTSTGQRLWFLVGVLLAGVLVVMGGFLPGPALLFLFVLYFIVLVSATYWIGHAHIEYEYWEPYSNTPGHGRTRVGHKHRFTDEFEGLFRAFLHGTGAIAFPSLWYSGWIWQQNEFYGGVFYNEQLNPFLSEMAYGSAFGWFFVLPVTWLVSLLLLHELRNGSWW
jgi:hypothetical protein